MVAKCDLRPLDFAQKCPQNAGNAISNVLNSELTIRILKSSLDFYRSVKGTCSMFC